MAEKVMSLDEIDLSLTGMVLRLVGRVMRLVGRVLRLAVKALSFFLDSNHLETGPQSCWDCIETS